MIHECASILYINLFIYIFLLLYFFRKTFSSLTEDKTLIAHVLSK